jgi:hypothetical protein
MKDSEHASCDCAISAVYGAFVTVTVAFWIEKAVPLNEGADAPTTATPTLAAKKHPGTVGVPGHG